jgi:hypothetical protein
MKKDKQSKSKALAIKKEIVHVVNPISGKSADIVLHRDGTTDEKLAMVLLSPDASKEQKDSWISNWLFERGKENASFIAELFVSKGTHLKETQAFKRQLRWDFEIFANAISLLFQDMADDIKMDMSGADHFSIAEQVDSLLTTIKHLSERLEKGAKLIDKQRDGIIEARMRETGYGVYLDRNGKAYSIFDKEIEEVVRKEKKEAKNESK